MCRCGQRHAGQADGRRGESQGRLGAELGRAVQANAGWATRGRKEGRGEGCWAGQQANRPCGGGKEWASSEAGLKKEEKKVFK